MHIRLGVDPVPQAHDGVALDALWPWRRHHRIFASLDAVGPIGVHREGGFASNLGEPSFHVRAGLPGLHATLPGGDMRIEVAETVRDLPCEFVLSSLTA